MRGSKRLGLLTIETSTIRAIAMATFLTDSTFSTVSKVNTTSIHIMYAIKTVLALQT